MATPVSDAIAASLSSWDDPAGAWNTFNRALASMFEGAYAIVEDIGSPDVPAGYSPGWSVLLDPTQCPAAFLPYAGLFVGVVIPAGTSAATARALIQAEGGFTRGTPGAIIAAAKVWLSGTQSVVLQERTAASGAVDPYHFILVVKPAEVIDATQLTAAVNAVKPAGVQWTLVQTNAFTWSSAIHTWSADTMTWAQSASVQP